MAVSVTSWWNAISTRVTRCAAGRTALRRALGRHRWHRRRRDQLKPVGLLLDVGCLKMFLKVFQIYIYILYLGDFMEDKNLFHFIYINMISR